MGLDGGEKPLQCPCCIQCKNCGEFQKIADLRNAGLIIYRHTTYTDQSDQATGVEAKADKSEDMFILLNTKDVEIVSTDIQPEFGKSLDHLLAYVAKNINVINITFLGVITKKEDFKLSCPRCRAILEHAERLIKTVPTIDKKDIIGICDHCKLKKNRHRVSCYECEEIVKKFLASTVDDSEESKKRVKIWLSKIKHLLKDAGPQENYEQSLKIRTRAHSELDIDKLCKISHKLGHVREPVVKQLFHPNADAVDRLLTSRSVPQESKKEKPDKSVLFKHYSTQKFHDEDQAYDYDDDFTRTGIIHKSEIKNAVSDVTLLGFEQPPDGVVSHSKKKYDTKELRTFRNLEEYIRRDLEERDEISEYQTEGKQKMRPYIIEHEIMGRHNIGPKIIEQAGIGQHMTEQQKIGQQMVEEQKIGQLVVDQQMKPDAGESLKRAKVELIIPDAKQSAKSTTRDFSRPGKRTIDARTSETSLQTAVSGVAETGLKKDFSYFFPKEKKNMNKDTVQRVSSSELIKDTKDKIKAKELEEKHKKDDLLKKKLEEEEKKRIAQDEKKRVTEQKKITAEERRKQTDEDKKRFAAEEKQDKDHKRMIESKKSEGSERKRTTEEDRSKKSDKEKQIILKDANEARMDEKLKESKEFKESRSPKEKRPREPREPKSAIDSREPKEPKSKETRPREPRETKVPKEPRELKDAKITKEPQPKEPKPEKLPTKIDFGTDKKEKDTIQKVVPPKPTDFPKPPLDLSKIKEEFIKESQETPKPKQETPVDESPKTLESKLEEKEDKVKDSKAEDMFKKNLAEETKQKTTEATLSKQQEAAQQKARELADKKAKEEAADKMKKLRETKSEIKIDTIPRADKKIETPTTKELRVDQIKVKKEEDDSILQLIKLKPPDNKEKRHDPLSLSPPSFIKEFKSRKTSMSDIATDSEVPSEIITSKKVEEMADIIVGQKIFKYKPPLVEKKPKEHMAPLLFKTAFKETKPAENLNIIIKDTEEAKSKAPPLQSKGAKLPEEAPKGVIHYALSDRAFIEKGWTMLPTEKVVRKMNVYRMRPAQPEFDWFQHNKNKQLMHYDSGEKLAEFDDNGRGRWYYRNGRLALDYYNAEEINAQQRFVVYSSGEPDERGRSHPITLLATFDYLGNGIVFDHSGKIRLKYNQTEGVVLDRSIGPVSHWKWHTLNDPPVLQQVMIDTQMAHKDPEIVQLGGPNDIKTRPDNEEMLAIEFDNFIKEKSKKLSQKFKPFQIRMKALKINEHFSLKVLDQATVYLIYRDGSTNLKLNIGMILNHQEIVDTDTAEVGEVSNNLERLPARTDSLAGLQRSVAYAQRFERARTERDCRIRPTQPCASVDVLTSAASRPMRPPLRNVPSGSISAAGAGNGGYCRCSRKPSNNLYYDTRLV